MNFAKVYELYMMLGQRDDFWNVIIYETEKVPEKYHVKRHIQFCALYMTTAMYEQLHIAHHTCTLSQLLFWIIKFILNV